MIVDKLEELRDKIRGYGSLVVAFSGGVDSTFLLLTAKEAIGEKVVAITADASFFPREEIKEARDYCRGNNIRQIVLNLDENEIDGFCENPKNRCYICKKFIFNNVLEAALGEGISFVADGTNADDMKDYRPGLKALSELKIVSPLQEAGFTKEEIRQILKKKGLPIWEKPAYACLASRIPYGESITKEKLNQIELFEESLHKLGFMQVRVRHHGKVARIEVLPKDREKFFDNILMEKVDKLGRDVGFQFVALDLAGYKMGSLNG